MDFEDASSVTFAFSNTTGRLSMNNFIIYNDDVLEDDEVFLGTFTIPALVSARKGEPSRTNIVIRSDDGKSHVVQSSLVYKCLCTSSSVVIVNFNSANFTVSESSGSVQVFLQVEGRFAVPLAATVHCRATSPESASGEAALMC